MSRHDGRAPGDLRPTEITTGVQEFAEGSALIAVGRTRVLCAASVSDEVPRWMRGSATGWVTAEYAMLPRATGDRSQRESVRGRLGGRTMEIQRLIGRSLRAAVDMGALGERLITIDCDVIQADGGTRTAAITGGWVALALALDGLAAEGSIASRSAVLSPLAAVSVGVVEGVPVCDLDYIEDSTADVDCNVVGAGDGALVEVQGTGEGTTFDRAGLDAMLDLAQEGIAELMGLQLLAAGGDR